VLITKHLNRNFTFEHIQNYVMLGKRPKPERIRPTWKESANVLKPLKRRRRQKKRWDALWRVCAWKKKYNVHWPRREYVKILKNACFAAN
jgi:hypothetical protein